MSELLRLVFYVCWVHFCSVEISEKNKNQRHVGLGTDCFTVNPLIIKKGQQNEALYSAAEYCRKLPQNGMEVPQSEKSCMGVGGVHIRRKFLLTLLQNFIWLLYTFYFLACSTHCRKQLCSEGDLFFRLGLTSLAENRISRIGWQIFYFSLGKNRNRKEENLQECIHHFYLTELKPTLPRAMGLEGRTGSPNGLIRFGRLAVFRVLAAWCSGTNAWNAIRNRAEFKDAFSRPVLRTPNGKLFLEWVWPKWLHPANVLQQRKHIPWMSLSVSCLCVKMLQSRFSFILKWPHNLLSVVSSYLCSFSLWLLCWQAAGLVRNTKHNADDGRPRFWGGIFHCILLSRVDAIW